MPSPTLTERSLAYDPVSSTLPLPKDCTPAQAMHWLRRNKYPLMAVAHSAPSWLQDAPDFQRELAAEREWYDTQRREYEVVRQAWLDRGIACVMFKSAGSYPSFPHLSDNLDILVPPERGEEARDILRSLGYVEVRNVEEPQPAPKFLFRKFHGGRCVCAIHVHEHVGWLVRFMDDDALWQRVRLPEDDPLLQVPSPEDAVLINLAHACYENKRLRFLEIARIRFALQTAGGTLDWAYMEGVARSRGWLDGLAFLILVHAHAEQALFGETGVPLAQRVHFESILRPTAFARRRLAAIRAQATPELPLDLSYGFCKRLYYRKILRDPSRTPRERWRDLAITLFVGVKLKSGLRPQRGTIISISGPDGSGKTAHAEALLAALRLCEIKTSYFWSRGGSTGAVGMLNRLRGTLRGGNAGVAAEDHLARRRQRLKNPLQRFLWSWLVAIDQATMYFVRVRLPALLGRVVVCDRYAYDTAVEMNASLPEGARWSRLAIAALLKLVARPQQAFVLNVAPATARARKREEVWHKDPDAERELYLELARRLDLRVISTEGPFADSNDLLIRVAVMTYMASFETRLNALLMANPSQKNVPDRIWLQKAAP